MAISVTKAPKPMTPSQAAKIIGCTDGQVRTLIRSGKLKARKVKTDSAPHYRYVLTKREVCRYRDAPQLKGFPRGQRRHK